MEGNQLFQEKKVEEAFQRYNMSVLRARSSADNKSEEENTMALSLGKIFESGYHIKQFKIAYLYTG